MLSSNLPCSLSREPRHASWFTSSVDTLLASLHVARVAADPPITDTRDLPGGWSDLRYHRLHGTPRIYYSSYEPKALDNLRPRLEAEACKADVWCIYDNTAAGAATANALELMARL